MSISGAQMDFKTFGLPQVVWAASGWADKSDLKGVILDPSCPRA